MNRWDDFRFRSGPKEPPPRHGIRVDKPGTTWWGQRWIEALERMSPGYSARLQRGKTYARAGRTHDLVLSPGLVRAKVTGSRPAPYEVTLELAKLTPETWSTVIANLAEQARFSADLLASQMPADIDSVFASAGVSLFPTGRSDLATHCSCPDSANPCKHVAATHYVLAEALDSDPFLLFELRGSTKDEVLSALRSARSGVTSPAPATRPDAEVPSISLGELTPEAYDAPPQPLPALHFSFDDGPLHGAVLRQLGTPASWRAERSPAEVLSELVHAAAERARSIALAEPTPEPPPPAEKTLKARSKSRRKRGGGDRS